MKLFTPNFTLLLLGQISSLLGNYTLRFAVSMYVLDLTGSAGVYSLIMTLSMLPTIVLSPLGGVLADRADRRKIMVALDALSGAAVLLGALWLSLGGALTAVGVLMAALSALVGCDEALCTAVNEYQTAAGAIGFGFYYPCVVQGKADGYKLLAVEGVLPSAETVESGEYPLTAEYLAGVSASAAEGSPERTLFDWLCGSVGQAFISSQGYFAPQAADDAALGGEEAAE